MVERTMPRVQEVVLPILRAEMPEMTFTTWVPDVDHRAFPFVNIRRLSGLGKDIRRLDFAVVEVTAYSREGLVVTEDLYYDVRQVIWDAVDKQIVTPKGHLHSFFETFGPTVFDSPWDDSWRVQGLIQLGVRPPRS